MRDVHEPGMCRGGLVRAVHRAARRAEGPRPVEGLSVGASVSFVASVVGLFAGSGRPFDSHLIRTLAQGSPPAQDAKARASSACCSI